MTEIKKIIKKYQNNKLCTCIDRENAGGGGFWDLAGKYASMMIELSFIKKKDFEIVQEAYYDGLIAGSGIKRHDYNYCNLK